MATEILENYTQPYQDVDTDIDHKIKHGFLTTIKDVGLGCILWRKWTEYGQTKAKSMIQRVPSDESSPILVYMQPESLRYASVIEAICDHRWHQLCKVGQNRISLIYHKLQKCRFTKIPDLSHNGVISK